MEKIKQCLKEENIDELNKIKNNILVNKLINILEEEINNFNYESNIDYLNYLIKILPKYIENNKKEINEKLTKIHQKIKTYLVQKPGNIDKTSSNYKNLKNIINNIEIIQMTLLYDYIDKYDETKYKLIEYMIFEVKNITFIKDAIKRFPYIVNTFDSNDKSLILSVIEKYIEEVVSKKEDSEIDNIIYYDEVIYEMLSSPKIIFDVIDKQRILKIIKEKIKILETEKDRKTFYLNILIEKITGIEEIKTNSYLEYKYHIKTYFNEAINSEVRKIINNYTLKKDRKIVDDYILTFDGVDAKEIDDALSIKILPNGNYMLGIHIADPTSLIDKKSIIFEEAVKRTTSIYLSDQTYSMFPNELSCNLLSLIEGNYRNAISYYYEIDKEGRVLKSNFYKTIIKVNKNMTYNDFNKILLSKTEKEEKDTITKLSEISTLLNKYYNEDELYTKINRTEKNITNTNITGISDGEKVVESTMVFNNYMVAKYFKDNKLPFIFRNHVIDEEMISKLEKIKNNNTKQEQEYDKYIEMVKNIYPKAVYGLNCEGHYGLGIECYSHITSPLRRFADVVAIICLEELYFNEYNENKINKIKKMVLKYSDKINKKRSSIEKFSSSYEENKK